VQKDGQPLTGTETQIKVAEAQRLIDEGHIADAVALLQTLQGPAAQTAQPWIQQAQATMAADSVQNQLIGIVLQQLQTGQNPLAAISDAIPQTVSTGAALPSQLPQLHF